MTVRALLDQTAGLAADYLEALPERPAGWMADVEGLRSRLGGPLPETPIDPQEVIADLAAGVEPGLVASPGGRYFGFVIGGTTPAAVAADWLTSVWDQNAGLFVCCPSSAVVEEVAGAWLAELLGLPAGVGFGLVTGCQMAHVTALAAARHECAPAPAGTWANAASSARRRSGSWPAPSATSPSTARCGCWGSGPGA